MGVNPLPYPMQRLEFKIFTILPPQGQNWCITALDKNKGGVFGKNQYGGQRLHAPPSKTEMMHTLGAMVLIFDTPANVSTDQDYENYIRQGNLSPLNGNTKVTREIERDSSRKDSTCFLSTYISKGHISETKKEEVFVQEDHSLICKHPNQSKIVMLGYSERYSENFPPSYSMIKRFWHEIEPFFNSLEFIQ